MLVFLYGDEMLLLNNVNQKKLYFLNAEKRDCIISLWYSVFTERNTSPLLYVLHGWHRARISCVPIKLLWLMELGTCPFYYQFPLKEKNGHDWPMYSCNEQVRLILEHSSIVIVWTISVISGIFIQLQT